MKKIYLKCIESDVFESKEILVEINKDFLIKRGGVYALDVNALMSTPITPAEKVVDEKPKDVNVDDTIKLVNVTGVPTSKTSKGASK